MLFIETLAQPKTLESGSLGLSPLDPYLIKNVGDDLNLDDLSQAMGISKFALTRLFHKFYGVAPMRWLWGFRAHLARDIISLNLGLPLMDVLTLCGFNSPQHFSRFFRKTFRQTPSRLMREFSREMNSERDLQKAKQELYDRFDQIVQSSLDRYKQSCIIEPLAEAEDPGANMLPDMGSIQV